MWLDLLDFEIYYHSISFVVLLDYRALDIQANKGLFWIIGSQRVDQ